MAGRFEDYVWAMIGTGCSLVFFGTLTAIWHFFIRERNVIVGKGTGANLDEGKAAAMRDNSTAGAKTTGTGERADEADRSSLNVGLASTQQTTTEEAVELSNAAKIIV